MCQHNVLLMDSFYAIFAQNILALKAQCIYLKGPKRSFLVDIHPLKSVSSNEINTSWCQIWYYWKWSKIDWDLTCSFWIIFSTKSSDRTLRCQIWHEPCDMRNFSGFAISCSQAVYVTVSAVCEQIKSCKIIFTAQFNLPAQKRFSSSTNQLIN